MRRQEAAAAVASRGKQHPTAADLNDSAELANRSLDLSPPLFPSLSPRHAASLFTFEDSTQRISGKKKSHDEIACVCVCLSCLSRMTD